MNQQRSRRFRAAQEAADKEESRLEAVKMFEEMGHPVSAATQAELDKKGWDTNAITPGTPFMDLLAASLRYWVAWKLNNDPGWKNLDVIISDASVPGEGEHKIMDWIRRQRTQAEHDPNTSHVIYGLVSRAFTRNQLSRSLIAAGHALLGCRLDHVGAGDSRTLL